MDMSQNYRGVWHHVYFDHIFNFHQVTKDVARKKKCFRYHAIRKKRLAQWISKPKWLKLNRGESRKLQHKDVTAVVWHDKRDMLMLSTNTDPRTDGTVQRKNGKGRNETETPCPQSVINYTQNMGDVIFQSRKGSTTMLVGHLNMVEIHITFHPECCNS
mgnify:CR=1 FL=1